MRKLKSFWLQQRSEKRNANERNTHEKQLKINPRFWSMAHLPIPQAGRRLFRYSKMPGLFVTAVQLALKSIARLTGVGAPLSALKGKALAITFRKRFFASYNPTESVGCNLS
jgi:hypothetical protein